MTPCSQPKSPAAASSSAPIVGLMIWTLVVFGLTLFFLWKVAFPRIAEALDKRQRMIEDSIDAAETHHARGRRAARASTASGCRTRAARPTRSSPAPAARPRPPRTRPSPRRAPSARR